MDVKFLPGGDRLVSGSADGTVRIWDVASGECQRVWNGHTNWVATVDYSPDGKTIASGSRDGNVILWNLDLDDLMAKGCAWLHDYLVNNPNATDEEREMCDIPPRQK